MKQLFTFIIGVFLLVGLGAFAPPVDVDIGGDIKIEHMQSDVDLEFSALEFEAMEAPPGEVLKPEADYAEYAKAPVHYAALNPTDAHTLKTQKYRPSAHLDLIKQYSSRLE